MNGENTKKWSKEEPLKSGEGLKRTCVEQVSNGFIKTVTIEGEVDGKWKYECTKSIHEENPFDEMSIADKLQAYLDEI